MRVKCPPLAGRPAQPVDLHLTPAAREKLAAAVGEQEWLVVMADGTYQSAWVFEKTPSAKYEPTAGFSSSKVEVERIVEG